MWRDLTPIGRDASSGGYRRFAWTREDATLREWFAAEAEHRGLDLTVDRVGNQWAWWGDPDAALAAGRPGVVTGSHLDSVPDGGAFDGPLGVVSALAAVDALRDSGFEPERPIGVVNFVDEEGARFGVACAGSRVLTGAMTADRARSLTDGEGISMAEALSASGRDPHELGPDAESVRRIGTFVEPPRRAGPPSLHARHRHPGRGGQRHLAARTVADPDPWRGQPRGHDPPAGPGRRDARLRRRRHRRAARR